MAIPNDSSSTIRELHSMMDHAQSIALAQLKAANGMPLRVSAFRVQRDKKENIHVDLKVRLTFEATPARPDKY